MASLVDETISSRSFRVRQLFRDLVDRLRLEKAASVDAETAKEGYAGKVVDALDRFNLWAGNIGALLAPTSRLSLDQRLADAPETKEEICQELKELAEAIEDLTEAIHKQCLTGDLDGGAVLIPVEDHPNGGGTSEGEPGKKLGEPDKKPFDDVSSLLDVISVYMESLFRLAMLVRKAGPRDRFKHALQVSETTFPDDFDINYLREKHPKLRQPELGWLLKRLGGANAKRRQFMKYCRDHSARLSAEPRQEAAATQERVVPAPTELLSSKATTFVPQGLAAAAVALQAGGAVDDEPEEEMVSQFSASTTTNALSALKLPSLEDLSPDGEPIECPICHTIQKFRHDRAWRAHAFRDMKAYVCIAGLDCNEMFGDRNTWFEHELHHHRARHICKLCTGGERLSSVSKMQDHFRSCHCQFSEAQVQMLIESGREPVTEFKASDCPFCDEWVDRLRAELDPKGKDVAGKAPGQDATVTASRFRRHVAAHQEQLAIFAMPRAVGDDGSDDEDGDEDITNSRAVAPTTVLDSVEADGIQDGAQMMEADESAKAILEATALGIESEFDWLDGAPATATHAPSSVHEMHELREQFLPPEDLRDRFALYKKIRFEKKFDEDQHDADGKLTEESTWLHARRVLICGGQQKDLWREICDLNLYSDETFPQKRKALSNEQMRQVGNTLRELQQAEYDPDHFEITLVQLDEKLRTLTDAGNGARVERKKKPRVSLTAYYKRSPKPGVGVEHLIKDREQGEWLVAVPVMAIPAAAAATAAAAAPPVAPQ